jgi:Domain of unknown function (DUF4440)
MKFVFGFLLLLLTHTAGAQTEFLKQAVIKLDQALVEKDTVVLSQVLHNELTYGHSNGWIETKREVIKDLVTGKMGYTKIKSKDHVWRTGKDWATLRTKTEIEYVVDGKPGNLELHVLQVWLKTNKGWQLLARQGTKM